MFKKVTAVGLIAALAVLNGGCALLPNTGSEVPKPAPMFGEISKGQQMRDELFVEIARMVPEFGGMFFSSSEERLQVYLTDTSPAVVAAVEEAIKAVFGADRISGIRVLQGQYGYLQLTEWYARMYMVVLTMPGVTLTDIDEAKNRLAIGVEKLNEKTLRLVKEELAKLGIPREAVVIEETGPIEALEESS